MSADSDSTLATTEVFEWKPGKPVNLSFTLMLNS